MEQRVMASKTVENPNFLTISCLILFCAKVPKLSGPRQTRFDHSSVGSVPVVHVTQALLRASLPHHIHVSLGESPKTAMHQENSQQSARLLFLSTQNDALASSAVQT